MWNSRLCVSDRPKCFYVYIMASKNRVLYIGVTNGLAKRVWQHTFEAEGFTAKHKVNRLVSWESFDDVRNAINREKELKGWLRAKKVVLVESINPKWKDLAEDWFCKRSDEQIKKEFARRSAAMRAPAEKPVY